MTRPFSNRTFLVVVGIIVGLLALFFTYAGGMEKRGSGNPVPVYGK